MDQNGDLRTRPTGIRIAQWSVGVTKPIHEICNIHINMNFMEAFGYILIKNDLKPLFKTAFRCFDKL